MAPTRHRWDLTPTEAVALQRELAGRVKLTPLAGPIDLVAGADCAFSRDGRKILAAAVLLEAKSLKVLAEVCIARPLEFPYVPGLLSFREAPAVIEALGRLPEAPDLVLIDGCGYAHPRRLGLASHVGLWLDAPTIGAAKSRLCGEHRVPAARRRSAVQLRHEGEIVGKVVRTRDGVRPMYVSPGHRITIDEAAGWTLRLGGGYRLPEPTRLADRLAAKAKRGEAPI